MSITLLTLILALSSTGAAAAQRPVAPEIRGAASSGQANEEYIVAPQDVISLTVFNDETQSRDALVVDAEGTIDSPYVGRVKVAGMTTRQIEDALRQALGVYKDAQGVSHGYLVNPKLSVVLKEYRRQRVNVNGAVRNPGEVDLKGEPTLTRALSEAGYPTSESGSYIVITHATDGQGSTGGPAEQIRVSREEIDNGRASRIRLRPGDNIRVPYADKFFIYGEVKSTGQLVLPGELNVLQALAMAGGLTERANKNNIRIQRIVDGRTVDIKASDSTLVQAGDTIVVRRRIF
jgi:polysaccharide export outer membrane protein